MGKTLVNGAKLTVGAAAFGLFCYGLEAVCWSAAQLLHG